MNILQQISRLYSLCNTNLRIHRIKSNLSGHLLSKNISQLYMTAGKPCVFKAVEAYLVGAVIALQWELCFNWGLSIGIDMWAWKIWDWVWRIENLIIFFMRHISSQKFSFMFSMLNKSKNTQLGGKFESTIDWKWKFFNFLQICWQAMCFPNNWSLLAGCSAATLVLTM